MDEDEDLARLRRENERQYRLYVAPVQERADDLEEALRALTAVEPLYESPYGNTVCVYCSGWARNVDAPGGGSREVMDHEPDCPWVRARALLGETP